MTDEQRNRLADYFSPSELVELLEITTFELILALEQHDGSILFDTDTLEELDEIMGVNG